ncbi:Uncharacterized protein Adt_13326 [Abeliophyllum distichum]|uniref:Uncharacterized protein n=1 Tax=Abeliophyllum distichum TaxID=126358 RepID=A0ABD1TWH3_9LAMI
MASQFPSVLIFLALIFLLEGNNMSRIVTANEAMSPALMAGLDSPPHVYPFKCVAVIGICDEKLKEDRCKTLCIDYFTDNQPYGYCQHYSSSPYTMCYCEYVCYV